MASLGGCSLIKEIKSTEDSIRQVQYRVSKLELKLKLNKSLLKDEKRETLEKELAEFQKLLTKNEEVLKHLHKDNRKTFMVASGICLVVFILWMLYQLVFGNAF